jgi:ribosomal protein L11 methyltransferase
LLIIFDVSPPVPGNEIIVAELGVVGFESFVETSEGLSAYIQKKDHYSNILENLQILENDEFSISYRIEEIEQVNWNAQWEANFKPITVDGRCCIRAPFHDTAGHEFDIVIEPKMSFGTGHHETTHMMIQFMLETDLKNKSVLDMGCGTAVLAILAEKKGSSSVEAIDIDEWCYQNSLENIRRNSCQNIRVLKGDASLLKAQAFDVIIANINRNILLNDIPVYATCLNANGFLFLSGFYKEDIPKIQAVCKHCNLSFEAQIFRNDWVALKFKNQ